MSETIELTKFEITKKEILKRAKAAHACQSGYKQAKQADNEEELLQAIKHNIAWCIYNKVVDAEYIEANFSAETLLKSHIYTSGKHDITVENTVSIVTLGSSSATIKTWDSSSATIETLDSSSATIKTLVSSSATI